MRARGEGGEGFEGKGREGRKIVRVEHEGLLTLIGECLVGVSAG